MLLRLKICWILPFLWAFDTFGQTIDVTFKDSLLNDYQEGIHYLRENQLKVGILDQEFKGEWATYMDMSKPFMLLGLKKKYRDSNCFTIAGIYNILAEIYLKDTTQKQILPLLENAFPEILTYSTANKFNFWKKLPPDQDLSWGPEPKPLPKVRRPTHFNLIGSFIANVANISDDADDTAAGNLALFWHKKIFKNSPDSIKIAEATVFDKYLDLDRKNYNWYNYIFKIPRNSGAYLTWLKDEHHFKSWSILKAAAHIAICYASPSVAYPHPYQPYIPFGANDVDAVLNANVLHYMAIKGELQHSKGALGANKLIEYQVRKQHWRRAGIYYPNRFHFHYAVSRAFLAGDSALKTASELLLAHIMRSQTTEGSFESRKRVNHTDKIQSTAYALQAMLNLKEMKFDVPDENIKRAIKYLLRQKKYQGNAIYWEGGVYFSGGTIVRNSLYFRSEAYTTALILQCFQKYLKFKP